MMEELRIAELLCTRLCHDLTGPIGAVNNGAEFLAEDGFNLQSQAVELITSSAFSAVSRLQFYRIAYGRVKAHGEASLADHQKMAVDFFTGTKVEMAWPDQYTDASGVSLSLRMVRLLYNMMIIASAGLLKGGKVMVKIERLPEGRLLEVTATGEALKWEAETETMLTTAVDVAQVTPKNVQLYLTRRLADELNTAFSFHVTERELTLKAMRPSQSETHE